ncbi:hypothetical protein [Actinomadura sp. WMMA1423]|nr:hypothetical protein [Actinomadura sp. WMMA1423]
MRSPFADRREDILPRSLADLIASEPPHPAGETPRRRPRRTRTVRRGT